MTKNHYSKFIEKYFSDCHFQMVDEKQDCVNCINACICSTLIVEGRIAHEFIHEIYENLYKNPHICNIIVYCSTEHELNTL